MENIKLRAAFDEARKYKSLREIAHEAGTTASTLSRYQNQIGKTTMDTIARLSAYLDVPMATGAVVERPDNMLYAIEHVIFADKNLTREAKSQLTQLMNVAYRGMVKTQEQLHG